MGIIVCDIGGIRVLLRIAVAQCRELGVRRRVVKFILSSPIRSATEGSYSHIVGVSPMGMSVAVEKDCRR